MAEQRTTSFDLNPPLARCPGRARYSASSAPRVQTCNEELVTIREAMRGLNRMVEQLENGEREKFVLTKGGKMKALVIPLGEEADCG